ncbi:MAG: acyl-CoA dehydrogenase family protein [Lautropia sp.]
MATVLEGAALERRAGELREAAREAIASVVEPLVAEVGAHGRLDTAQMRRLYRGLAPLGYVGSTIPVQAGGAGMSYVEYGLLLEALACAPLILGEVVPPRTVFFLGNASQQARWLPGLLAGDMVSTAAITEPQAGSDLRAMTTTALPASDGFRLNGSKKWIKLGGVADLLTVLAITDPKQGHRAMSRLVVTRDQSPWAARELPCVGMRNFSFAQIDFDGLAVPAENLLGSGGDGVEGFYRGIEASRALLGLQAAGIARAAIEIAKTYAGQRTAFGRTLSRFQAVQVGLADCAARVEASRALSISALQVLDSGRRCGREASMAKVFATETAVEACSVAMSSMGAFGLSEEAGVERHWRDAKMLTVIDGTSDIQRLIVGREEFGVAAFT